MNTPLDIPDRDLHVLPPSDKPFDPSQFEVPDSFYDFTPDDLKHQVEAMQSNNKKKTEEEQLLRTKAMRERDRLSKIPKYKKTLIKIRFPNRLELQGTFHPRERVQAVVNFVRDCLAYPDRSFHIFTTPPKQRLDNKKSLLSLVMVPAAIVYFAWDEPSGAPQDYLREELIRDIADKLPPPAPSFPQSENTSSAATQPGPTATTTTTTHTQPSQPRTRPQGDQGTDYSKAVPKWFKTGKK